MLDKQAQEKTAGALDVQTTAKLETCVRLSRMDAGAAACRARTADYVA